MSALKIMKLFYKTSLGGEILRALPLTFSFYLMHILNAH